jgi:hypothetical protein
MSTICLCPFFFAKNSAFAPAFLKGFLPHFCLAFFLAFCLPFPLILVPDFKMLSAAVVGPHRPPAAAAEADGWLSQLVSWLVSTGCPGFLSRLVAQAFCLDWLDSGLLLLLLVDFGAGFCLKAKANEAKGRTSGAAKKAAKKAGGRLADEWMDGIGWMLNGLVGCFGWLLVGWMCCVVAGKMSVCFLVLLAGRLQQWAKAMMICND